MKRRLNFIGVILIVLICSMVTVCAQEANKTTSYENKTYNFKLEYPVRWMVKEGFMGSAAAFMSTLESASEFHPNVNVVVQDLSNYPNMTLDKFESLNLSQLEKFISDFKLISNEKCSLSGKPALMYIFDGKQGMYNLRWMQVYSLYNNKVYVITFTSGDIQFDKYKETAQRIINSFEFN